MEDNIQAVLWMWTPSSSFHLLLVPGVQSDLERQLVEEKWEMLCEIMQDKAAFVFGKQGCLTDTELHTALKVRKYFQQFCWLVHCAKTVYMHKRDHFAIVNM